MDQTPQIIEQAERIHEALHSAVVWKTICYPVGWIVEAASMYADLRDGVGSLGGPSWKNMQFDVCSASNSLYKHSNRLVWSCEVVEVDFRVTRCSSDAWVERPSP